MRKLTVTVKPNFLMNKMLKHIFSKFESVELKELMKVDFLKEKKGWSKYKDIILNYYLKPYVSKVLRLRKKVVIIDCCAGPGVFDDGEIGSPMIINNVLSEFHQKDADVAGYYIEQKAVLHKKVTAEDAKKNINKYEDIIKARKITAKLIKD